MARIWYLLLAAVPVAFALHLAKAGVWWTFACAAVGIMPLSSLLGKATEGLAERLGPTAGGLLNATFGNASELILGLAAVHRGLLDVVKASLIGSIIGNALLVLGGSLLVAGWRHGRQQFDRTATGLQAILLLLAAIGLCTPSLVHEELGPQGVSYLSLEVAGILLCTYVLSLAFSLMAGREREAAITPMPSADQVARGSLWGQMARLAIASVLVGFLSEFLVEAIEEANRTGMLDQFGITQVFLGVIVIAFIGNVAEHASAVIVAYRNQVTLSLHIAVGSSLQIALLVTPVLVFASYLLGPQAMDLRFSMLEVVALGSAVLVVAFVAADGESHWMEGVLLLAVYLILALAFYHLPVRATTVP